jgi:hypothetical protein
MQYRSRAQFLVQVVLLLFVCAAHAEEPPTGDKPSSADAAAEAIKHDAKVVGAAVKDGAEKVGVAAKEVALQVADAAQEGAHEVAAAAKTGAAKTKAAVSGEKKPRTKPEE